METRRNPWAHPAARKRWLALGLLLVGVWLLVVPARGFWEIRHTAWLHDYQARYADPASRGAAPVPLAVYLAQQRGDRPLLRADGAAYVDLAQRLRQGRDGVLVSLDQAPLAGFWPEVDDFGYLRVDLPTGVEFWQLEPISADQALDRGLDPARAHPWRWYGPALILAGLAVYILAPWARRRPEALYYPRPGLMVADLMGLLLAGGFWGMFLAIFVHVPTGPIRWNLMGPAPIFVGLGGLFAALWGALLVSGAFHEAVRVTWDATGITKHSLTGVRRLPWSSVSLVEAGSAGLPGWLVALLGLLLALAGRPQAPGLGQRSHCLVLVEPGGRPLTVWLDGLRGMDRLLAEVRRRGLPLAPDLANAWADEDEERGS